jgi:phage terminase large subunit
MTEKQKLSELLNFTPKQLEAMAAADTHRYTLFGGAAGPGKSYWLRWYMIRKLIRWAKQYGLKGIRAGLFCEDYPSLKDRHVSKLQYEYPEWLGKLKDSISNGLCFELAPEYGSGIIALRNLDDPSKYLSSEFALIGIDELTRNEEEIFDKLRSRLRWTGIEDTRFIAATNPGGIGHAWVKKRWIDRDFDPNEVEPEEFCYVPALPTDNPYLAESYLNALKSLPDALRQAYLEGSWSVFAGQFFNEWRETRHVVDPYTIPDSWRRIRCIDHGRAAPTACLWGAIDHDGRVHWYREYYRAGVDADVNAREINRLSAGERYWFTVMDSACYSKTGTGETIAEIYHRNGVVAEPSPKDRHAGWALFHEYLRGDEHEPGMVFFRTCVNAIKSIPTLVHDDHDAEDLDTRGEDHAADAISYALQYLHEAKSPKAKDPLEQKLDQLRKISTVHPGSLNRFYNRK